MKYAIYVRDKTDQKTLNFWERIRKVQVKVVENIVYKPVGKYSRI